MCDESRWRIFPRPRGRRRLEVCGSFGHAPGIHVGYPTSILPESSSLLSRVLHSLCSWSSKKRKGTDMSVSRPDPPFSTQSTHTSQLSCVACCRGQGAQRRNARLRRPACIQSEPGEVQDTEIDWKWFHPRFAVSCGLASCSGVSREVTALVARVFDRLDVFVQTGIDKPDGAAGAGSG